MENKIIEGVCRALMPLQLTLYREKQEQGFARPSLFVEAEKSSLELFRGNRYFFSLKIKITYYPPLEDKKEAINRIKAELNAALYEIALEDGSLRCKAIDCINEADRLTTTLEYGFYVVKENVGAEEVDLMGSYKIAGL